ncbi:Ribonuclease BN [Candidatus Methanoperedenaceae archaeon GB50]|nr:Ribonuclease BN [Candidatus Methanoperedenaceae archaeon GB50]
MRITLLGTGDATGTPKIDCSCPTCKDALNGGQSERLRSAILVETEKGRVLIDTGPDLRYQLIREGITHVDGCIWTHSHYDHYAGFVEFHRIQKHVPVYGVTTTLDYILNYLHFLQPKRYDVRFHEPFELIGATFTLFEVSHPRLRDCAGMVIEENGKKVAITGDTRLEIPVESIEAMMGADLLITDAIAPPEIRLIKHMNAEEALEMARRTDAKSVIFTHISHLYPPHNKASLYNSTQPNDEYTPEKLHSLQKRVDERWPLGYDRMKIRL